MGGGTVKTVEQIALEAAHELATLGRKCRCDKCMKHDAKIILRAVRAILKEQDDAK